MGELDGLVSKLLNIYTCSIKLLKSHRKKHRGNGTSSDENPEEPLVASLRNSRSDIIKAYRQDAAKAGPEFSHGDAKSRSSLSAILSRLDRIFTTATESFSRGNARALNQEKLMKVSDASRADAIHAFAELSHRISQSSSSISNHRTHQSYSAKRRGRKSTSSTKSTALGPATKEGWIRSKRSKKSSRAPKRPDSTVSPTHKLKPEQRSPVQISETTQRRDSPIKPRIENRKSGISFATDSTKLGEIPRYRVARLLATAGYDPPEYPEPTVLYPLNSYKQKQKPRSRLGKLFKKR